VADDGRGRDAAGLEFRHESRQLLFEGISIVRNLLIEHAERAKITDRRPTLGGNFGIRLNASALSSRSGEKVIGFPSASSSITSFLPRVTIAARYFPTTSSVLPSEWT